MQLESTEKLCFFIYIVYILDSHNNIESKESINLSPHHNFFSQSISSKNSENTHLKRESPPTYADSPFFTLFTNEQVSSPIKIIRNL